MEIGVPAKFAIPGSVVGGARPCAPPRIWGRLHGSLLFCFRKDVALVSHCVPVWGRGPKYENERKTRVREYERP